MSSHQVVVGAIEGALGAIGLDWLLGVAGAIRPPNTFKWSYLADQGAKEGAKLLGVAPQFLTGTATWSIALVCGAIVASILPSIKDHLVELAGKAGGQAVSDIVGTAFARFEHPTGPQPGSDAFGGAHADPRMGVPGPGDQPKP